MATPQLAPAEPAAAALSAPRRPIPLARRRRDLLFVAFFLLNLGFITYIVDLEQLVIADPAHFSYPLWPPGPLVDLVHWYGRTFDPLLLARPVWWKMTIWIDALGFGPFYAVAMYAYLRGREWIRVPTLLWAGVMLTNVTIILGEEFAGPHATPQPLVVFLANLPWLLVPLGAIARMAPAEHPFSAP
jgi:EXPERA (EXPanded EBP superfamily)